MPDQTPSVNDRSMATCDECGSSFLADVSPMDRLCPECAHWLYGYDACEHTFVEGRCIRCSWDGSVSAYVRTRKQEDST